MDRDYHSAAEAIYLSELGERIDRLQMLHEEMEKKKEPWHWLKQAAQQR